ncbi:hypothetical protein AOC36_01940 [Erysipelothrix larvae]|uniref:Uncharacterized protein n=1 Tax=Erysipelothrix larvae TaxID=1514105 RepID=A0A0X8GYK3_9FIRM|nr:hypothetical protein [Erysipelothrix larvae]AMC92787.1 hypothetical protein AOC36_01940 [Erysipelothrix larvae]
MFGYNYSVLIAEIENALESGSLDLYDTIFVERDSEAILDYYPIRTWHFSEHEYSLRDVDLSQLESILDAISELEEGFEDMEETTVHTVLEEMKEKSARLNASYSLKH